MFFCLQKPLENHIVFNPYIYISIYIYVQQKHKNVCLSPLKINFISASNNKYKQKLFFFTLFFETHSVLVCKSTWTQSKNQLSSCKNNREIRALFENQREIHYVSANASD